MSSERSILFLTETDVQQTLTVPEAVDLAESGIRADAAGQVVGDKFYTSIGEAGFIKPFTGYIAGEEYFFVKTFTFFSENPARFDLPATGSQVSLDSWVRYWKSRFRVQRYVSSERWQKNYWDRTLRSGESYEAKWNYVRQNPVRHGLVASADEWPFQGEIHPIRW